MSESSILAVIPVAPSIPTVNSAFSSLVMFRFPTFLKKEFILFTVIFTAADDCV